MAGLIAYGTAGIVSAGRTPTGTWQKRSRGPPRRARPGQPLCGPVTCAVSDGYSARILNERLGAGIRYALSHRRGPAPWQASPPRPAGANGRGLPPAYGNRPASIRRSAACDSGPPICCLRQLALEVSHRAQYRLFPVVVGLRQTRRRLGYKRQDLSWHYTTGVNGIQASA